MGRNKTHRARKIFFDLKHPADFNLFSDLIFRLTEEGYKVRVSARNKDRLQELLRQSGIAYRGRGKGSRFLAGKYLVGIFILLLTLVRLILFRPGLTISLSSPYLILASRILRIPTLCYDDNDTDHRLHLLIRRATYIVTPLSYSLKFHEHHFRLPVFKEMAYLPPAVKAEEREGVFIRITRTDSTHHSRVDALDQRVLNSYIESFTDRYVVYLSSETVIPSNLSGMIKEPGLVAFHEELNRCKVFWGNSATMAAEAALLGIPAVYVAAEISSCLRELKETGLLFHYTPDQLETSLVKVEELMEASVNPGHFIVLGNWIRNSRIDIRAFLFWAVTTFPESMQKLISEPDWQREFGNDRDGSHAT